MTEIILNKIRRDILETCEGHAGAPESKWHRQALETKAITFLVEQGLLRRELGDAAKSFTWRLHLTDRGRAALRGDILTKIEPPPRKEKP